MKPIFPTRRIVLAIGPIAVAAALLAPAAGAITPEEMNPHRQTVAEMEMLGAAMIAWFSDQSGFGAAEAPLGTAIDVADFPPISHGALEALLVPDYIAALPEVDGWGNPYDYRLDAGGAPFSFQGLVRSSGEDGAYEGSVYTPGDFLTLADDPVWANGVLVRRPGPPLLDYRARQVRNTSEMRDIGTAMFAWLVDHSLAPRVGGPTGQAGVTVDLSLFTPITEPALEAILVPSYLGFLLPTDAWGGSFDLYLDTDLPPAEVLAIRSRGRGGAAEGDVYTAGVFDAGSFDSDMVWADGVFVRVADLSKLIFSDDFEVGDFRFWSASSQ